ncbi:hypothetical protein A1O3_07816 [Capronia epimyces CBS 606.96]|uniref:Transcription factor domain-containing protein n=1 Tax=Capronia epimyces CBS 606.96 TaxID=1182542 RepID=W9XGA2_9EURO|nr:uncharacterized protein A1O3_07816 [Capronia epimyces CBS 606.96]EXJ79537.1 hypothetical protein A1O3_07816 [Capronia epimyces CBS 606.96]
MCNWYSASLFCLDLANYMRDSNMMHVQAIGILQMCCHAAGDIVFRPRLLAIGIRIANNLGMPFARTGTGTGTRSLIESEVARRLWWVFVINEWLGHSSNRPYIHEADFDMLLPLPMDDDELESGHIPDELPSHHISPWLYTTTLCQIAVVFHRFNRAVQTNPSDLEIVVNRADSELTSLMDGLPAHLRDNVVKSPQTRALEAKHLWIRWQREDLKTTFLLFRAKINHHCHKTWTMSPSLCLSQRILCLQSARSVISVYESSDLSAHQRRYM